MRVALIGIIFQFLFMPFVAGQTWEIFDSENSLLPESDVNALFLDEFGAKWFGTNEGLVYYSKNTWSTYTTENDLASDTILHIAGLKSVSDPKLYISTPQGVSEIGYDDSGATTIASYNSLNSGLESDSISTILPDTGDMVYFASDIGLSILKGESWLFLDQIITNEETVSTRELTSMAITPDGWNYMGTSGHGVARLHVDVDGVSGASSYGTEWSGLLSDRINDIHINTSGNQWYATDKGLAYHIGYQTKENWDTYTQLSSELISNKVQAIAVEENGTIWAGTDMGISSFDGFNWLSFTDVNGISGISVFDLEVDIDHTIWVASNKGVMHYDEFEFPAGMDLQRRKIEGLKLDLFPGIARDFVTLKYAAPVNSNIELSMMDLNGNIVRRSVEYTGSTGHCKCLWNLDDPDYWIPSGLYIICLKSEREFISKKILVVR